MKPYGAMPTSKKNIGFLSLPFNHEYYFLFQLAVGVDPVCVYLVEIVKLLVLYHLKFPKICMVLYCYLVEYFNTEVPYFLH